MTTGTEKLTGYDARLRDLRMRRRYFAGVQTGPLNTVFGDYTRPVRPGIFRTPEHGTDTRVPPTVRPVDVDGLFDAFEPVPHQTVRKPQQPASRLDIPYIVRTGTRVVYFDLDGVICDDRHRVAYAQCRDWGQYFGKMTQDVPWRQGRDLYEGAIVTGWDIAYLTGRREDTRQWTVDWLQRHGFDHTLPLVMRPEGQRMPLANLKALVVEETLRFVPEVILYDDDPEVIKAVNQVAGAHAVHCTWHKKEKSLIKKAQF